MDSIIFNIIDTDTFEDEIKGLTWLENDLSAYDPLEARITLDDDKHDDDGEALIDEDDVFH